MTIEDKFCENVDAWETHCKKNSFRSDLRSYLDCDAYRNLAEMGKKILPLIKTSYKIPAYSGMFHMFPVLVKEIVKDKLELPEGIRGNVREMEKYTIKWLDKKC